MGVYACLLGVAGIKIFSYTTAVKQGYHDYHLHSIFTEI